MNFIELNLTNDTLVLVNLNLVRDVFTDKEGFCTISFDNDYYFKVKESIEFIRTEIVKNK